MELNYATGKVNIHSCGYEITLKENKGGHPVLSFTKPSQADLHHAPKKYWYTKELKVVKKARIDDEIEAKDVIIYDTNTTVVKKGTRKKLLNNMKDALEAFKEGVKDRPAPKTMCHVENIQKKKQKLFTMGISAWTMMVSMVAAARGWETWQPITIESGYDLITDSEIGRAHV